MSCLFVSRIVDLKYGGREGVTFALYLFALFFKSGLLFNTGKKWLSFLFFLLISTQSFKESVLNRNKENRTNQTKGNIRNY